MTVLTWELCSKTEVKRMLFPPLWLQPHPRQKFPSCPVPGGQGTCWGRQRNIQEKQLSCLYLQALDFSSNPSSEGKAPASLMGGWSWPSWGLSLAAPRGAHLLQQPLVVPPPPSPPRAGLCHCCCLRESKNIQKQLSEVRLSNAYLST